MNLEITELRPGIAAVRIDALRLDAPASRPLRAALEQALRAHPTLILDLSTVAFMDSAALGVLLHTLRLASANAGQLALANVTPPVRALLELVRATSVLPIYPSVESALEMA
ncbi:MAG: STAS domain-containing protein [Xanthomonadales bacterium]|jgi:anti-anti-sigma factor|nr:STAS domain-containing protein [Xanthomonadales bacterium]